ncbi:MAG: hypothetical protein EON55_22215 [Alphaproteobacteria bacterium]|nr:MAG: hypothetical protein EON55_22215 [Alphaproteobacteria bacterium]
MPAIATGLKPSDLADHVGDGLAAFEGIVMPTRAQLTAVRQMHSLLKMGEKQPEGQQRRAYRYLHQSGAGKSTCAKILVAFVESEAGYDPATRPVLHVTLSTTGTPKSLASSILDALGDNYSTRGEAELLLRRVRQGLKDLQVKLLIIDELNHFKQKSLATDAANTIKNILSLGWVPIVLMGTTDAQSLFANNRELKNRCAPQVVLAPYGDSAADEGEWARLLGRIDAAMVQRQIVRRHSGLGEEGLAAKLRLCSNGLIGEFHNILMTALEATLLADEDSIGYQRLVDAVDAWCMSDATIDRNFLKDA